MKITLLGAAGGEVTGSCYLVETRTAAVLVDCGFFQGSHKTENFNRIPKKGALKRLNAVVLTHAHLDHTGRLPLLAAADYNGPIYGTQATFDLADLIMADCAHLHEGDVKRQNKKRAEQGKPKLDLLFTLEDVERLSPLYRPIRYHQVKEIADGITVRLVDAGHIFGSSSIEMKVTENGKTRVVIFSGDLGPRGAPMHRDPTPFEHADLLFLESTYGDRNHRSLTETAIEGRKIIAETIANKGKILVPAFAIGRTQLLMYLLAGAFRRKTLPAFPIFIDSPMAIKATEVYRKHAELFDEEALAMRKSGDLATNLKTVRMCPTADDSRRLNDVKGPCLIMAGAGMCTGGRILHHLKHGLPLKETTVLIVGFQSHGSLGRLLVDGKEVVSIHGQRVPVNATVKTMGGLSGHADQTDLMNWFGSLAGSKPRVILTHGEDKARGALAKLIQQKHRIRSEMPAMNEVIEF